MNMIALIENAKASAKAHIADSSVKVESFSETLKGGEVVTCIPVCSSNAFETVIGHVKITWKVDGKRATGAAVETLYKGTATPEELEQIKRYNEKQKWLKKFGL